MLKGFIYLLKTCWKFDKIYIFCLIIKNLLSTSNVIISLLFPKYIIDSLFTEKNSTATFRYIVIYILSAFIINILSNLLNNITFKRRMLTFKKFQLYLAEINMTTPYYKLEDAIYLDNREKAYKYLYGNGSGFAQVLEDSFDIIGKIMALLSIMGIIIQLNILILLDSQKFYTLKKPDDPCEIQGLPA